MLISRRQFVATSVGCCALAAVAPLLAESPLKIGIGTYSYHSLTIDEMIMQLQALRITTIEMSRGEFMLLSHPKDAIFNDARARLDRAGIRCLSYYSATMVTEQDIENAIRFAKLLGATNITGDASQPVLKKIDQRLTEEGMTFGLHNHFFQQGFPYESADQVLHALDKLSPTMGATADTGQFASCGQDPAAAVRKLAGRLRLVHLKDVKAAGEEVNVLLGQGVAKIPEVMRELHRQNFGGLVAVEYEKEGPVDEDLRQEISYARSLA